MGLFSPSFRQRLRLYAYPLLGATGPMDPKGYFRFKGAGARRTSRGYAVRRGGTAGDVAASIELSGEVPPLLGWRSSGEKRRSIGRQTDPV